MKAYPRKTFAARILAQLVAVAGFFGADPAFAGGRVVMVDTEDNGSAAGDGHTSLLEALQGLQPEDVIQFNIPGTGPHLLKTPLGGYPLITVNSVLIDGYSQPGASPNTHDILAGNNANIQIYLDSTDPEAAGDPSIPDGHSTRLPFSGFGDSENAMLGLFGADHVRIRGLGFLSHQTAGETADPAIYCIALVNGADDCRVQGCRFGLAADGRTVQGGSAGIAGYTFDGVDGPVYSTGLVFGTDGDGVADVSEFNLIVGMHIAVAVENTGARIAGNYFNVLPDGKTFVDINAIHQRLLETGRSGDDASVENIENGGNNAGTIIGTNGDGVSDANERNIFNLPVYGHLIEFYSHATNVVIAGNYFGVGVDGLTSAPAPMDKQPDLVALSGEGSVRLGSDGNGVSDELEGNLMVGIAGNRMVDAGAGVAVLARGNTIRNCGFDGFPFADTSNARAYADYYAKELVDAVSPFPALLAFENGVLTGTLPAVKTPDYPRSEVDVYLAEPSSAGSVLLPGTLLTSFVDNGPGDTNPADNQFSVSLAGLTLPPGGKLVIAVSYSGDPTGFTLAGLPVTGPLSEALVLPGAPLLATPKVSGENLLLTWTGGQAPFTVQTKATLAGTWLDVVTTNDHSTSVSSSVGQGFFRLR